MILWSLQTQINFLITAYARFFAGSVVMQPSKLRVLSKNICKRPVPLAASVTFANLSHHNFIIFNVVCYIEKVNNQNKNCRGSFPCISDMFVFHISVCSMLAARVPELCFAVRGWGDVTKGIVRLTYADWVKTRRTGSSSVSALRSRLGYVRLKNLNSFQTSNPVRNFRNKARAHYLGSMKVFNVTTLWPKNFAVSYGKNSTNRRISVSDSE